MKVYKLFVTWECYGELEIEAENIEQAIDKAYGEEIELPVGYYVDDSFVIDELISKELNHDSFDNILD
jgi:cytochrome c oxidase assembly protein Cox11